MPLTPAHHRCCKDGPSARASGSVSDEAADGSGARGAARRAGAATPGACAPRRCPPPALTASAAPAHTAKTEHRYRSPLTRPGTVHACVAHAAAEARSPAVGEKADPEVQQHSRPHGRRRVADVRTRCSRRASTAMHTSDWRGCRVLVTESATDTSRHAHTRLHAHAPASPYTRAGAAAGERTNRARWGVCVRVWPSVSPVAGGGERAARASRRGGAEAPRIRGVRLT